MTKTTRKWTLTGVFEASDSKPSSRSFPESLDCKEFFDADNETMRKLGFKNSCSSYLDLSDQKIMLVNLLDYACNIDAGYDIYRMNFVRSSELAFGPGFANPSGRKAS